MDADQEQVWPANESERIENQKIHRGGTETLGIAVIGKAKS
jgi:hypothetical protein